MIGSTATRIYVVAVLILATYGVNRWVVQAAATMPETVLPHWTFGELPLQIGDWRGVPTEMDPEIAVVTGADRIVNREYKDDRGHAISMHTAMFKSLTAGFTHSPMNCYRAQGWQLIKETQANLPITDAVTIPASLSTWDKGGDRVLVLYWYQIGDHVLSGNSMALRWDFGCKLRWAFRGQPKWPAVIKVMLQISAPDPEDAKTAILGFAGEVAKWENLEEHRQEWRAFDKAGKGG